MKGRKSIISKLFVLLLALCMVVTYLPASMIAYADDGNSTTAERVGAEAKAAGDSTVLAFTSDVHNGTRQGSESNVSANRLDTWLSNVQPKYNNAIKVMGFCGDMASAQSYDANYWGFAETVMNRVSNNGLTGVYAVGNHEYANGHMNDSGSGREDIQGIFALNKEGRNVESDNYRIYCLGTNHGHGSSWAYEDSQITALTNYLNSASNDKVTIILTHFPLHDYGMHKTSNTAPVLNALNAAAVGADGTYGTNDDKKIVYLWGHNHSEGDTNYDQVWLPGDEINDTNTSTVNFYYAAAGSMADSEYGQSGRVKGKGLVLEIDDQKRLAFTYYDANGNNVTEPDSETISEIPQEPVAIEDVSITNTNLSVRVGKTLQLSYSTTPKKATVASATWNSNKESVATVDQNGKVTAVSEGTATITLTVSDGLSRATATTSAVVTVTAAGTSEEHTVSVTPSTSNPEETIHIEVGDTLVINTTNGSSNSAYDFTASLSKSGVAEFQGSSSQNIAAGGTGQFTVEGAAEGSVDITIQNSNSYGSQYARKATIHLTVGEGGDTPVDPPTGDTVNITPTTDNPEESIKINVGDTLTINVTNGSSNSAYDFTATLSNSGIAQLKGNATVNIAAGGTGQFTVEGLADGTVDITIQNSNTYGSQYARKGVIHLTVGEGGDTPVDPPTGDTVNITPTTDNPEESIKINVGDTLTINVTNGSSNSAYDFTASLSNSGIAQLKGNATVNIAAGSTGQFTVEGLAEGTVDITIQNSNTYGSQYTRKGVIHLTVGESVEPDAITLSPATLALTTGKTGTLTATVTPAGANKTVTWESSNTSVATVANGVVTAVAQGSATITAKTVNNKTATCAVTVTDPEPGAETTYVLTDTLEDGKEYLIANGNSGSVYILSNESGGSRKLNGVATTVTDGKITISEDVEAKTAFTAELKTSTSGSVSAWLKNNGKYLYTNSNNGLTVSNDQTSSDNTGKFWHYKADGKNLLWYFKDTNNQDGYTDTTSTYKYYLSFSNGAFTDDHASTTSLANTTTPAMYIFVKDDGTTPQPHTHTYGDPTWAWTGSDASGYTAATATFTCTANDDTQTVNATVTSATSGNTTTYTATATFNGSSYTDTKTVTVTPEEETTYILTDTMEAGKEYLIANGNTGSVFIVSNETASGSTSGLKGVSVNVVDGKITITSSVADKTLFSCTKDSSSSDADSTWLMNGGKYLYADSSGVLRLSTTAGDGKYWHYKADGKNLLWFFQDSKDNTGSHGYSWAGSTYRYYVDYNTSGTFIKGQLTSTTTSLANTTTPKIYIFVKDDGTPPHTHTYGDPTWAWTGSDESGYTAATATFTCTENDDTQTVNATVTSATSGNTTTYTATATFNGSSYTDTKTVTVTPPHTHTYGTPTWTWADDYSSATATFTCAECGESTTVTDNSPDETVVTAASCTTDKVVTYTAVVVLDGAEHSDKTKKVTISGTATGHRWSEWTVTKQPTCTAKGTETRSCSICNEVETRDIDATGHSMTAHEAVAATCTTAGNSAYWSCSKCNKFFSDADGNTEIQANSWVIPAQGHKLTKTDGVAATCTTAGNSEYWTCSVCGKFFSDADGKTEIAADSWILPAKGHTLTKTNAVAATCLEGGNEAYWTCSVCGKFFGDGLGNEEIEENSWKTEALGHNWSEWKVTTPATELKEGVETRYCSRCDETETRIIEKLTHVHQMTPVAASEPTCEEAGNTAYWFCNRGDNPCGKYFSDANGEHEITEIGSWIIPALGHDLTAHEAVAATCTEDGNYAYWTCGTCGKYFGDEDGENEIEPDSLVIPASGHDWGEPIYVWANDHNSVTAQVICNNDTDHVVTELVGTTSVTTEPTCEEAGKTVYTTKAYNNSDLFTEQTDTIDIPALGHTWSDWEVVTPATETSTGVEERTCSVCKKTETRDIPVLGHEHKLSHVDAVEATCTEPGVIEYWICDQGDNPCGKIFGDADGTIELNTEDLAVPAKDHTPGEAVVENEIAATCETAGSYEEVVRCTVCGNVISREVKTTEALGHDWGKWEVTTPATKEAAGVETRKCSRCDATETRPIDKLAPEPGSDPNQKGSDGTAVGPGASAAAAEAAITGMKSDTDPKGAAFGKLTMRSSKQTNTSITLNWTKVKGASKYVIYGHKCGKTNKPKKLYTVTGNSMTLKKVAGASIKKGTYYKFIVVALDKNNNVVTTSKLIHVATKGGKVGNHKSVTIKKAVLKKAKALKKGKSLSLKPTVVPQSKKLKVKKHVGIRYESSNKKIATVSSSGKITAKSKGTCYVYVFAQSGVFKKVKVVVK